MGWLSHCPRQQTRGAVIYRGADQTAYSIDAQSTEKCLETSPGTPGTQAKMLSHYVTVQPYNSASALHNLCYFCTAVNG